MIDAIKIKREIALMRKKGLTYREIAPKYGVTSERIRQIHVGVYVPKPKTWRAFVCEFCNAQSKRYGRKPTYPDSICDNCDLIFQGRDRNRERVRIKYNRTCQQCFKVWQEGERRLDIHHLNDICGKKSRTYDRKFSKGLIPLCHKCHFNHHSWSGGSKISKSNKLRQTSAKERRQKALDLFDAGNTRGEIAQELGVTSTAVTQYILER